MSYLESKRISPNTKLISLAHAGIHEASIIVEVGLHLTTCLSNSLNDVRAAKQNALLKKYQLPNGDTMKLAAVGSITMNVTKAQADKFGTYPRSITFYPVLCLDESKRTRVSKSKSQCLQAS